MKITLTINGTPTEVEINDTEKSKIYQAIDRDYKREDIETYLENCELKQVWIDKIRENMSEIVEKYKKNYDDYEMQWEDAMHDAINEFLRG